MTKEQAQLYIQDKYDMGDLDQIESEDWSLEDNLRDADIVREKITNENEDISFE